MPLWLAWCCHPEPKELWLCSQTAPARLSVYLSGTLGEQGALHTGGRMLYNGPWEEAETYMALAGYG